MRPAKRVLVVALATAITVGFSITLGQRALERRNRKRADKIWAAAQAALGDLMVEAESFWESHRPVIVGPTFISGSARPDHDEIDASSAQVIKLRDDMRQRCLDVARFVILQPYRQQLLRCGEFTGKEFYFFKLDPFLSGDRALDLRDDLSLIGIDISPLIRELVQSETVD